MVSNLISYWALRLTIALLKEASAGSGEIKNRRQINHKTDRKKWQLLGHPGNGEQGPYENQSPKIISILHFTTVLSHFDFSHGKFRLLSRGKPAATESRYPTYGACWVF